MIATMKKDVSIWNINSLAEFYMQIEEKYKTSYRESLVKLREERARFESELEKISGIRVIPSQANYVMLELQNGYSTKELSRILLIKYSILIKDLSAKVNNKQYIRVAVRDFDDNNKLIFALKKELEQ